MSYSNPAPGSFDWNRKCQNILKMYFLIFFHVWTLNKFPNKSSHLFNIDFLLKFCFLHFHVTLLSTTQLQYSSGICLFIHIFFFYVIYMYSRHGKLKVFRDIPLIIRWPENEDNDFVRNFYFQSNVLNINIDTVQRLEYLESTYIFKLLI